MPDNRQTEADHHDAIIHARDFFSHARRRGETLALRGKASESFESSTERLQMARHIMKCTECLAALRAHGRYWVNRGVVQMEGGDLS